MSILMHRRLCPWTVPLRKVVRVLFGDTDDLVFPMWERIRMSNAGAELRIGFLTSVRTRDKGFVGGLLVTDSYGRPLEFQCTTPVKPNRTQELLYGPTLEPFILGDLLGKTLLGRIGVKPTLVVTDREGMLELRRLVSLPILSLCGDCLGDQQSAGTNSSVNKACLVTVGQHQFRSHNEFSGDAESAARLTRKLAADANLQEPLERVSDALRETMATVSGKPRVA